MQRLLRELTPGPGVGIGCEVCSQGVSHFFLCRYLTCNAYRMEFVQYFEELFMAVCGYCSAFSMDALQILGTVLQPTYHMGLIDFGHLEQIRSDIVLVAGRDNLSEE